MFIRKSVVIMICCILGLYLLPADRGKVFALIPLIAAIVFSFLKSLITGLIALIIIGGILLYRFFPPDAVKSEPDSDENAS